MMIEYSKGGEIMNRIKELRKSHGLSQTELARETGISNQAVSFYENGKRQPKIETWQRLAKFFNVSVPYIQGLTYTTEQMVRIIHDFYFSGYDPEQAFSVSDDFSNEVNIYIKVNSDDVIPRELYREDETKFVITDTVEKYWLKHFKAILDIPKIRNVKKNNYYQVIYDIHVVIEERNRSPKPPHDLTYLGQFFMGKYEEENAYHSDTIDKIKYLDLSSAKMAISEYADLIIQLRDEVNNFKKDSYKEKDYNKKFAQYVKAELYNLYEPTKHNIIDFSKIIDELVNKIMNDREFKKKLLNEEDKLDYLEIFRNYKKQHNEDVTVIDEYIEDLKDREIDPDLYYKDIDETYNRDNIYIDEFEDE